VEDDDTAFFGAAAAGQENKVAACIPSEIGNRPCCQALLKPKGHLFMGKAKSEVVICLTWADRKLSYYSTEVLKNWDGYLGREQALEGVKGGIIGRCRNVGC
jgi:hypothetical protein